MGRLWRRQAQPMLTDRKIGTRRNDVEMLGFDRQTIRRLLHLHCRMFGKQIHHKAFVCGVEVLNQNESHADAGRQRAYQL